MEKESEKKRILKLLLETYSIEEIKEIFQRIDQRIIDLMEFSSKDFAEINKALKTSHQHIKRIQESSQSLFSSSTWKLNERARAFILDGKESLMEELKNIQEFRKSYIKLKEAITHNTPLYLISIKNLNQNIGSLLLWISTHMPEMSNKKNNLSTRNSNASDFVTEIKTFQKNLEKNSLVFKTLIEQTNTVEHLLNEPKSMPAFPEKLSPCAPSEEEKKRLEDLIHRNNSCISDIVTNVQYHDIVRQRVEHIQEIHNEIVKELELIKNEANTSTIHTKVKYFLQIRDISGLQAAQLFNVNKDYQNAIKTITKRLLELSENLGNIKNNCEQFSETSENCPKHFLVLLEKHTELIKEWRSTSDTENQKKLESLNENLKSTLNSFHEIKQLKPVLDDLEAIDINHEANKQLKDILLTLQQDLNDCLLFENVFTDIHRYSNEITTTYQAFIKMLKNIQVIPELIAQLKQRSFDTALKIEEITSTSEMLSKEFNTIVNGISYYEYFDQVIEQVIDELNTINLQLLEDDITIDQQKKKENLEFIRNKYTMQSEHDIHEMSVNDDFVITDSNEESDENDVEFF